MVPSTSTMQNTSFLLVDPLATPAFELLAVASASFFLLQAVVPPEEFFLFTEDPLMAYGRGSQSQKYFQEVIMLVG